jgi:hypothetical protein
MAMNFLDAAADLVSLGFRVFPLVPGKKTPLIPKWQKAATDDADPITAWAEKFPTANIGIATGAPSGVVVLDLDEKDGRSGMRDLALLATKGKKLPPSPIAVTPSGGRHLYFRAVPGLRNVAGVSAAGRGLGPGIDVRADGGFVVAPPSELHKGHYRWLVPPMSTEFPRLPDWAVKMLMSPPAAPRKAYVPTADGRGLDGAAKFVARALKGERNHALFWASARAGELVAKHKLSEAEAAAKLTEAAAAAGLRGSEVANTYRQRSPRRQRRVSCLNPQNERGAGEEPATKGRKGYGCRHGAACANRG